MREILFRGKREDNGEWVFGYPIYDSADCTAKRKGKCVCNHNGELVDFIAWIDQQHEYGSVKINPSTVGQYTGLTDKNDRKIFEGDIIEHNHPYGGKSVHAVTWDKYGWNLSDFCATYFDYPGEAFSEGTRFMTVIGNIYDNPELLEVKQNG